MSLYTTEVRYICEEAAGYDSSKGYLGVDEVLDKSWNKVVDFNFPLWDDNYRKALVKKILLHYYTREIGFETVGLWKLKLMTKLNEIMPYYNELYKTTVLKFNPLYDVDYTKSHEGTAHTDRDGAENASKIRKDTRKLTHEGEDVSKGTSDTTVNDETDTTGNATRTDNLMRTWNGSKVTTPNTTKWDVYSDTPQGALDNVANETYLTNARKITETGGITESDQNRTEANTGTVGNAETNHGEHTGTSQTSVENTTNRSYEDNESINGNETNALDRTEDIDSTDQYIDHVVGKMSGKPYYELINGFRKTLLNIDMMIINDLNDLFFLLWEV